MKVELSTAHDRGAPRGARSKRDIDAEYLVLLDEGFVQSRTHIEQMAMSPAALLRRAFPSLLIDELEFAELSFIARLRASGSLLRSIYGADLDRIDMCWVSDTVRGWLAMSVAADGDRTLGEVIHDLLPFARDHHFAVREWAWLAARPRVCRAPLDALKVLETVASSADHHERRFAIELTRPRSVWGTHISEFKSAPEQAASLLDAVRCDASAYVRTAVGNWLNDAAKSQPGWLESFTQKWLDECACRATAAIVRRGRRRLRAVA